MSFLNKTRSWSLVALIHLSRDAAFHTPLCKLKPWFRFFVVRGVALVLHRACHLSPTSLVSWIGSAPAFNVLSLWHLQPWQRPSSCVMYHFRGLVAPQMATHCLTSPSSTLRSRQIDSPRCSQPPAQQPRYALHLILGYFTPASGEINSTRHMLLATLSQVELNFFPCKQNELPSGMHYRCPANRVPVECWSLGADHKGPSCMRVFTTSVVSPSRAARSTGRVSRALLAS